MRLAAHQPQYLPWLGYFDKMARVDLFVLLDTVQFKKNEWQNRNRIRTSTGWQWLTVPVHHRFPMRISEVRIDDNADWRRKHKAALRQAYAKAAHRGTILPHLEELIDRPVGDLATLNIGCVRTLAVLLGVATRVVTASSLADVPDGPDDRLIALCRMFGATTYLAGQGGHGYMDLGAWRRAGIAVEFQEFRHPVYTQGYLDFTPNLSAVDTLVHLGPGCLAPGARPLEDAA